MSDSKHFLIVVIGSLVTINVYLPQQGLYERDQPIPTYRLILDEILAKIESLGSKYAFFISGDFNNSGPNAPHFRAFCDILQPDNWSSHIKYTFSAKGRGGINTTKIDHVLTKNFTNSSLVSCETTDSFITKSPHSPIETITRIPHLSIRDVDLTLEGNLIPKTKIDFQATTQAQKDWILDQATEIVKKEYPQGAHTKTKNPIRKIHRIFTTIGTLALCHFPQRSPARYRTYNKPGWNIYVKDAQREYAESINNWNANGNPRTGHTADEVCRTKQFRDEALEELDKNEKRIVAEVMSQDFVSTTSSNRSLCWKPIRASVKGDSQDCSPIIENETCPQKITDLWFNHYRQKLNGTIGPTPTDLDWEGLRELESLCSTNKVVITPVMVRLAISGLNNDCAYYDSYTPELLHLIRVPFSEAFAYSMTDFLNRPLNDQVRILSEGENFLCSYIRPISKGSDLNLTLLKSYRPISVSHCLYMLSEKLMIIPQNPHSLRTSRPRNFFGYIPKRSVDIALQILKTVMGVKKQLQDKILITLDASGAFENVIWRIVFKRLAAKNDPKVVKLLWLFYAFNRYELVWGNFVSESVFCATKGTKQGGIVSGPLFCEYMSILSELLCDIYGMPALGVDWNALFFADDVLLLAKNLLHAQLLLAACEKFQNNGFVNWNSSKTKVLVMQTSNYALGEIPEKSDLFLNGIRLDRVTCTRWLGYQANHFMTDDDMILRQCSRLYALGNNLKKALPLELVHEKMLVKLAKAYGCIYLLPALSNSKKRVRMKLKAAHRSFVLNVTALIDRKPELFCPINLCFKISTDDLYTDQTIKTVEQMKIDQTFTFWARFRSYVSTFSSEQAVIVWEQYCESQDFKNWEKRQNSRIADEIRRLFADANTSNTEIFDQFNTTCIYDALTRADIIPEELSSEIIE